MSIRRTNGRSRSEEVEIQVDNRPEMRRPSARAARGRVGRIGAALTLIAVAAGCSRPADRDRGATANPAPPIPWAEAPSDPETVPPGPRPRLVLLTAPWCQWCRVLEHEVLPTEPVRRVVAERYVPLVANVDAAPLWMDLPGIEGLPTFAFFDSGGRHVLTRSGFREAADLAFHLEAIGRRIAAGEVPPYPPPQGGPTLPARGLSADEAARELRRIEREIFWKINSNDGGFGGSARHPYPEVLVELERWRALGAPERVGRWVDRTVASALRGRSPRLDGDPLPDLDFSGAELADLARRGPDAGLRWREGVERLATADPFEGIQDPIDFGVFRYAAGPGWYHPHFERAAADNLAWAVLLRARGDGEGAERIARFVDSTFADAGLLAANQRSDPFYYRLRAEERRGVPPPSVSGPALLKVQARAARVRPARCDRLLALPADRWPRAWWTEAGEDPAAPAATADAVGELLLALSSCAGGGPAAGRLASIVAGEWSRRAPGRGARLHRLAAGVCAANPGQCARALAAVAGLAFDPEFAPPLEALARAAGASKP